MYPYSEILLVKLSNTKKINFNSKQIVKISYHLNHTTNTQLRVLFSHN